MPKHLSPAIFLLLPVSLSLTVFAHRSASTLTKKSVRFGVVFTDSIPVEKKSSAPVNPSNVKLTQVTIDSISRPGIPLNKNYYTIKFKGSHPDTTGFIYDLNAFYHLGK